MYVCMYVAICKNIELLIYISIYILGCIVGFNLKKNIPWRQNESLSYSQQQEDIHAQDTVLKILHVYPHYSGWKYIS